MIKYSYALDGTTSEQLKGFFVGWPNPPSPIMFFEILDRSTFKILAIDKKENRVVGFINANSDCVLSAYIPLLEVLPEYQGKGIGKELLQRMLEKLQNLYMVDLACDPETQSFYEKCGFKPASAMMIRNYKFQHGNRIEP